MNILLLNRMHRTFKRIFKILFKVRRMQLKSALKSALKVAIEKRIECCERNIIEGRIVGRIESVCGGAEGSRAHSLLHASDLLIEHFKVES